MMRTSIMIVVLLLFFVGMVWLQIFLSKRQSKILGLVLPVISFIYSLIIVLGRAAFESMSGGETFVLIASTLLLSNIPTIVLIAIYIASREKFKRNKEIERMNIQDLEWNEIMS